MDLFGLGIMITMVDRATPSLQSLQGVFSQTQALATQFTQNVGAQLNSLMSLSGVGMIFNMMGDSMINAGKKIISPLIDMGKQLTEVNSKFDTIGATFKTAFGADAQKKMDWVANFAIKTPFQVENTAKALVGLKNAGIDATKSFKDANGEMKPFLQFAGDLATLNMNAQGGGGLEGMLMAIRNAASGAPGGLKSLQSRFDIPKDQIKSLAGKTGDAFMQEFSKIAIKLTPNAMQNMVGTWDQIISEMKDNWDVFLWNVGKAGAFDPIKKTLMSISQSMYQLFDADTVRVFADVIKTLWQPIDYIAQGLLRIGRAIKEIIVANPFIGKLIVGMMGLASVTLITGGVFMKLFGTTIMAISTFGIFMLLLSQTELAFKGLSSVVSGFIVRLLPLVAVFTGVYLMWKYDLFNLRTQVTSFFGHVKDAFSDARRIMSLNAQNMSIAMRNVDASSNPFAKLEGWIVRMGVLWQGLVDAWNDNTISEDTFQKLKNLGLLPAIEAILDFKMKAEAFFSGFKQGLNDVQVMLQPFEDAIKGIGTAILSLLDPTYQFSDGQKTAFDTGPAKAMGEIVGIITGLFLAYELAVKAVAVATTIWNGITKLMTAAQWLLNIALDANPVGAVILLIASLIGIGIQLITHWGEWTSFVHNMWVKIKNTFSDGVNYVIDKINAFIEKLNGIPGVNIKYRATHVGYDTSASDVVLGSGMPVDRNANGTSFFSGGMTMVGENGPELVNLNRGAQVVPNDRLNIIPDQTFNRNQPTQVSNDNSVVFEKGSINVSFQGNGTEQDANAFVEVVMKKIERKQQLRKIANYQPAH